MGDGSGGLPDFTNDGREEGDGRFLRKSTVALVFCVFSQNLLRRTLLITTRWRITLVMNPFPFFLFSPIFSTLWKIIVEFFFKRLGRKSEGEANSVKFGL